MSGLEVHLFGRFSVRSGERVVSGITARKVQELFAYLLLHRDRAHHREILADVLWNDSPSAQSRKCLRQALWRLQAALRRNPGSDRGCVLTVEPDWVQINPGAALWVDVKEFEEAFGLVQGVAGGHVGPSHAQTLDHAVQLYQGDLLEGWYQDWCVYERERLQQMYLAMLDKLMDCCAARQQYETAILYGFRGLRHDAARERTHRRLIRLYYLSGDRISALRQYDRCLVALRQELGVKPARRTMALYERIREDQVGGPDLRQP